ncbi:MAG: AraC family transcriptional regulator [Rubrivivax sp.]|nr:AraC family transcriptional regulator [Rubrivivax sp.]
MNPDILSDVLRSVRLRAAVFYYLSCGPRWAAEAPPAAEIGAAVMPGAEHVMEFHVVTKGGGWAALLGEPPIPLSEGDILMFPHGDAHVLSSHPGLPPQRFGTEWTIAHAGDPRPILLHPGAPPLPTPGSTPAADAQTHVVCGFLGCDLRPYNPLVATLPRLLHLRATGDSAWIAASLERAVQASTHRRPGSQVVLERISETMFAHAVSRYLEDLSGEATGWLAGLRDRHVGRALALLHERPAEAWSLEALGKEVGLSRSALHERFVALVGTPPMLYLAQWRMQLAARQLRETQASVAAIAQDVGYESEAAFARAFKRLVGAPPAAWRRSLRGAEGRDGGAPRPGSRIP